MKSKGLGDSIQKFTKSTGIESLTKKVMKATGKEDCGCEERKEWLNNNFPYKNK